MRLTSVEICAGAGGQAAGLERAGFEHIALVELDRWACETLRTNRPEWNVIEQDLHTFDGTPYAGVDLLAGGVPCPPFSVAGKRLGELDDRDLFPQALRLVGETRPHAVMLENVRGLLEPVFEDYRAQLDAQLRSLGYEPEWRLLQAADYGVPQLRPRAIMVAMERESASYFEWPEPDGSTPPSVGQTLRAEMASRGWPGAAKWAANAATIAPTLVGGSHRHGGPDLGPTRARQAWAKLGVDGLVLADEPPGPDYSGVPRLTVHMAALIQGFDPEWTIAGRKTNAYRQVGNAFPPPVAAAVGAAIAKALRAAREDVQSEAERVAVAV